MKNALRTVALVAVVVAVAFGYVHLAEKKGYALKTGSEAPGFRLPSLAGGEVDLASYRGQGGGPELLGHLVPALRGRDAVAASACTAPSGPEGLAVVTVSTDEDEEALREFVTRLRAHAPRAPRPRRARWRRARTARPATRRRSSSTAPGASSQHTIGPAEWDAAEALAHFRGLLENTPGAVTR